MEGRQYLGYDWRAAETNPRIRENYERHQRYLAHLRDYHKRRRLANPPPSRSQGSLQFRGWSWLCPRCGRQVRILLLPLPRLPAAEQRRLALPHPQNQYFACERCHRVRRLSRCEPGCWNAIVTYLSAGLLYGREVERPAWLKRERKRKYAPKPTREPSRTRARIEQLLLAGRTFDQIAAELHLTRGTVAWRACQVYKQHGVHGLGELLIKNGRRSAPRTKNDEVRRRVIAGQSLAEIASAMGISRKSVSFHMHMLRKAGKLPGKRLSRTAATATER